MPQRRIENPDQLLLFDPLRVAGPEPALPLTEEAPAIPQPVGPVVWLADRAADLLQTLQDTGEARKLGGFERANESDSPYAPEIQQRYGASLPSLRAGATSKEIRLWRQAWIHFIPLPA